MAFAVLSHHPLRWLLPIQAALLLVSPGLLPIWGDEQFTLNVVALSWREIGPALASDIHPPLYFLALKLWMGLSQSASIEWARLFSALIALSATVALDRLWLPRFAAPARTWFLALWCLSPLLLLDARMARSYSLQTLFAILALAAMVHAVARPTTRRAGLLGLALAALLYTHYLPGLAIGAVALGALARKSVRSSLVAAALAAVLYLPWVTVLIDGLTQAASKEVYRLAPSIASELVLRIGYWIAAFSFGEAYSWATLAIAVLVGPWLLPLLLRGYRENSGGLLRAGLLAAPIGLLGTWRWVAFSFTPARLLFLLPVYLLALAVGVREKRDRYVLGAMLALNLVGVGFYFAQHGFLNPGYLVPYGQMVAQIEKPGAAGETLVVVDALNGDPTPLLAILGSEYRVIVARDDTFVRELETHIRERRPATVWHLGAIRDVSPGRLHEQARELLEAEYHLETESEFLPYNSLQQSLLELFSDETAPRAHYAMRRWERGAAERLNP